MSTQQFVSNGRVTAVRVGVEAKWYERDWKVNYHTSGNITVASTQMTHNNPSGQWTFSSGNSMSIACAVQNVTKSTQDITLEVFGNDTSLFKKTESVAANGFLQMPRKYYTAPNNSLRLVFKTSTNGFSCEEVVNMINTVTGETPYPPDDPDPSHPQPTEPPTLIPDNNNNNSAGGGGGNWLDKINDKLGSKFEWTTTNKILVALVVVFFVVLFGWILFKRRGVAV